MKAMILAAGFGTRLRPFSALRPKPLFPVMGRPLLLLIIEKLRKSGFSPIIVNCHYLKKQIADLLKDEKDIIVQEEEEILGTGGGLRRALSHFDDEPVLVTNGDIFHDIDFGDVYRRHIQGGCRISMVMHDFPRFNNVVVDDTGIVNHFVSSPPVTEESAGTGYFAFTGIHVIDPQEIEPIPQDCFFNIIDRYKNYIQKGGRIQAVTVKEHFWTDIGTPEDYLALHEYLLGKEKEDTVLQNITQTNFWSTGEVRLGKNVRFANWGVVGNNVVIGNNVDLERVVIWDGAVVEEGQVLKNTIVTNG